MEGKLIMKSALIVALVLVASAAVSSADSEAPPQSVMETFKRYLSGEYRLQADKKLGSDNFGTATLDDVINPDDLLAAGPSPNGAPTPSPTEEVAAHGPSGDVGSAPSTSPTSSSDDEAEAPSPSSL